MQACLRQSCDGLRAVLSPCACMPAGDVGALRDVWESTSFALERLQSSPETVAAEQAGLAGRQAPKWALPWTPAWTPDEALGAPDKPRVAVLRWGLQACSHRL